MSLSLLEFMAVLASATFAVAAAWFLVRPYRTLAGRVRPYTTASRVRLIRSADVGGVTHAGPTFGNATLRRLFRPMLDEVLASFGRLVSTSSTGRLALRLRQSGLYPELGDLDRVQEFRVRSFTRSVGYACGLGILGLLIEGPVFMVVLALLGFTYGVLIARGRLDKAVTERRERMRGELYTINQLIAMRTRVGGGVADAIRHVVIRGSGAFVDELAEVLRLHESGVAMSSALERAASLTSEPEAARTFSVLATAQERGADLGEALFDLSRDLRAARREEMQRDASRRRLLMVVPIVVILAPIVLLFIAGPIPQIIFGGT